MSTGSKRPRMTTKKNEQRLNTRYSKSGVWTEGEREEHRETRDANLEQAGLITDRRLGNADGEPDKS